MVVGHALLDHGSGVAVQAKCSRPSAPAVPFELRLLDQRAHREQESLADDRSHFVQSMIWPEDVRVSHPEFHVHAASGRAEVELSSLFRCRDDGVQPLVHSAEQLAVIAMGRDEVTVPVADQVAVAPLLGREGVQAHGHAGLLERFTDEDGTLVQRHDLVARALSTGLPSMLLARHLLQLEDHVWG